MQFPTNQISKNYKAGHYQVLEIMWREKKLYPQLEGKPIGATTLKNVFPVQLNTHNPVTQQLQT